MVKDYTKSTTERAINIALEYSADYSDPVVISGTTADMIDDDASTYHTFRTDGIGANIAGYDFDAKAQLNGYWLAYNFDLKISDPAEAVDVWLSNSFDGATYDGFEIAESSSATYVNFKGRVYSENAGRYVRFHIRASGTSLGYIKVRQISIEPLMYPTTINQLPPELTGTFSLPISVVDAETAYRAATVDATNNLYVKVNAAIPTGTNIIGKTYITDGVETASVTTDDYLDVKTHSSDKCFHNDYAAAQAAAVIITPTAGKKFKVIQVYVSTEDDGTDVTLAFGTSGDIFFKLYSSRKSAQTGNIICGEGAVDETIKLTCGPKTFVSVSYDEV